MACNCISRRAATIILWICLPILAFSIVILAMFPSIYQTILDKEIALSEGSIITNIWKDIPLPIYENVYFFNVTNSEDFIAGRHPLNVTQVGPYTYKSHWVKPNPIWNSNNTVSYRETRTYHFVPEMSNGTEDDEIYTLNGPMILASSFVKDKPFYERIALSAMFGAEGEHVVTKRKIRELTYEGYEDPIIKYAPVLKPDLPYKHGIFSWLYGKNDTNDGLFTVFTGADNISKGGILNNWNGQEKLDFWKGDTCNMLNGTNIETGPPIKDTQNSYTFFQSIFCRSLTLNYTNDESHLDIPAKRFRPTFDLFANGTENPDNYCFDVNKEYPSGVLDVSPCQFGAPVFISFPHFHMADKRYLDPINGLSPNDEEHGSVLDVEPRTGFTIYGSVKLQINVEVTQVPDILQLNGVTEGIFPILWVELHLSIDEKLAKFLIGKLENPKIIVYSVLGFTTAVSFVLSIIALIVLVTAKTDEGDDSLLEADNGSKPPYKKLFDDQVDSKDVAKQKKRKEAGEEDDQSESLEESKLPKEFQGV